MKRMSYKQIILSIFLICNAIVVAGQGVDSDSAVIRFLAGEGVPITSDNRVTLLNGGKEKYNDLLQCIKEAKHHIHLEYFNFRNDSIAGLLFELLAGKAKQGVEVRAVFDAFGNYSNNMPLKKKHLDSIRKNGIEIVEFDPLRFPFVNHVFCRDHRKIVVIDGKTAYAGGINVADYYINGLPEIGEWRDIHLRIEGSAAGCLQRIFLEMWNRITGQKIDGIEYFPEGDFPERDNVNGKTVAIVDRVPKKLPRLLENTYLKAIGSAKYKIRIINPYFLPTSAIRKELKKAIARNVNVEIMISAKLDIKFTPDGVFYFAHKLMRKGADIYIYNSGFHHSKVMIVDDRFCVAGSANLDYRSLRYDYETNALIFDRELVRQLNAVFDADIHFSTKMTPGVWKKRSLRKRLAGWLANGLSPLL
jgi:cardiolipin synthase